MTKQNIPNKQHFASNIIQKKSNSQQFGVLKRFIRRMRHFQISCGVPKKSQAILLPLDVVQQNILSRSQQLFLRSLKSY
jgi:hypothetical protein